MKHAFIILLTVLAVSLASCDSSRVYQQVYDFEPNGWHLDTIPAFDFNIKDRGTKNLVLHLRNTIAYEYQNVYLNWYLEDSTGQELASDLVNIQLFDSKTGEPLGQGSSIYQHEVDAIANYSFPAPGNYTFRVAQYMREMELKEITSVGLRVEESEK